MYSMIICILVCLIVAAKPHIEATKETWTKGLEQERERTRNRSLKDVYNTIEKWLYIQDTKRIKNSLTGWKGRILLEELECLKI